MCQLYHRSNQVVEQPKVAPSNIHLATTSDVEIVSINTQLEIIMCFFKDLDTISVLSAKLISLYKDNIIQTYNTNNFNRDFVDDYVYFTTKGPLPFYNIRNQQLKTNPLDSVPSNLNHTLHFFPQPYK